MKKILIALSFALAIACKQQEEKNSNIPQSVITSIQKKYPEATDIKWEELHDTYQARFTIDEQNKKIVFNNNGTVLIDATRLPKNLIE